MVVSKGGNRVKSLLISADPQNVGMIGFCHAERPHRLAFAVSLHQERRRGCGLDGLKQGAGLGLHFGLWLPAILRNSSKGAGNRAGNGTRTGNRMVEKGKSLR